MNKELLKLAETNPQVKKMLEDVALMAEYIKLDIDAENFDENNCAIEDYSDFAKNYKNVLWICTDPDNQQYGRKLAAGHYEFKEKNPKFEFDKDENEWIEDDILLNMYDEVTIKKHISAYHDSINEIKRIYGEDWEWIVAECIFEQESGLY